MLERDLQKQVLELFNKHPLVKRVWRNDSDRVRARKTRSKDRIGLPDVEGFRVDGNQFYIELKRPKGNRREAQKEFIEDAQSCGIRAGFAESLEEALTIMEA